MGYGKYLEPTLSERLSSRRWSSKRIEARRKLLELGTKQEQITKIVKETKGEDQE